MNRNLTLILLFFSINAFSAIDHSLSGSLIINNLKLGGDSNFKVENILNKELKLCGRTGSAVHYQRAISNKTGLLVGIEQTRLNNKNSSSRYSSSGYMHGLPIMLSYEAIKLNKFKTNLMLGAKYLHIDYKISSLNGEILFHIPNEMFINQIGGGGLINELTKILIKKSSLVPTFGLNLAYNFWNNFSLNVSSIYENRSILDTETYILSMDTSSEHKVITSSKFRNEIIYNIGLSYSF